MIRVSAAQLRKLHIAYTVIWCMALSVVVLYAVWYLGSSRAQLADWYLSLGSIYEEGVWTEQFFTQRVKLHGNAFCVGAMITAIAAIFWRVNALRSMQASSFIREISIRFGKGAGPLAILLVSLVAVWIFGNNLLGPSYDEAFSAVFTADAHPFHAISYYMLPNNHVLFNFLNNLMGMDLNHQILSGRILSLLAYLALGIVQYFWFRDITKKQWVSAALVFAASTALVVWGFSFQARGYMLLLLASWSALISLEAYMRENRKRWLVIMAVSCFIGYTVMPSFLYFHIALILFALSDQMRRKKLDWALWKSQGWSGGMVFLFYLPALTFSGIQAFTNNKFVRPRDTSIVDFAWQFVNQLPEYANYGISNLSQPDSMFGPLVFILPLAYLPFAKHNTFRLLGHFAAILLATTLIVVIVMKATPFYRTLIFQLQFGFVAALLVAVDIAARIRPDHFKPLRNGLLATCLLAIGLYQINRNRDLLSYGMYFYDVNGTHLSLMAFFNHIPKSSKVYTTDQAFYMEYLKAKHLEMDSAQSIRHHTYIIEMEYESAEYFGVDSQRDTILVKNGYRLLRVAD